MDQISKSACVLSPIRSSKIIYSCIKLQRVYPPPVAKKQVDFLNSYLRFISIAKTCIYKNYHMMTSNYEISMFERLKQYWLKTTPIRRAIIDKLSMGWCDGGNLITKLKWELIANEATIYRAIHDLSRVNILHSIMWQWQPIYYLCSLEWHEHVTVSYCIWCHDIKEINNHCSHNHQNLLSDRREIIVDRCQSCQ